MFYKAPKDKEYESFLPFRALLYLLLSVEGCDNLKLLTIAATTANPLPTIKQTAVLRPCATKLKSKATNVVPVVCPNKRAIPSIPLAHPERCVGAEEIIVLLFGVWNSPKPAPHNINLRIILMSDDSAVRLESEKSPTANRTIPMLPNIPG